MELRLVELRPSQGRSSQGPTVLGQHLKKMEQGGEGVKLQTEEGAYVWHMWGCQSWRDLEVMISPHCMDVECRRRLLVCGTWQHSRAVLLGGPLWGEV